MAKTEARPIKLVSPLLIDSSGQVRQAAAEFFSLQTTQHLQAHIPYIMLFVHSSMTHISQPVRADSSNFLSIILPKCSQAILSTSWNKTLRCFSALLGFSKDNKIYTPISLPILRKHMSALQQFLTLGLDTKFNDQNTAATVDLTQSLNNKVYIEHPDWSFIIKSLSVSTPFEPFKFFATETESENIETTLFQTDRAIAFSHYVEAFCLFLERTWLESKSDKTIKASVLNLLELLQTTYNHYDSHITKPIEKLQNKVNL